jgi:hypothetical protein
MSRFEMFKHVAAKYAVEGMIGKVKSTGLQICFAINTWAPADAQITCRIDKMTPQVAFVSANIQYRGTG